jgi:SAM-dependent methyltransferase
MYRTELLSRIGVSATGDRVLDIGSFDNYWLSRQDGTMRIGVDLDVRPSGACHAMRADGLNLPFSDALFDSAFAFDVIEHVNDDARFVAELIRVVRPGGSITVTTPNADLRIFPAFLTGWAHQRWGHDHCTGYEPGRLQELFNAAGATSVTVRQLRTRTFLSLYLPLSVLSRLSQSLALHAFRAAAVIDSRWGKEGKHGYLLATASA